MSNRVEMSIVPWWYARLLTILYAEPDTYRSDSKSAQFEGIHWKVPIFSFPTQMSFRSFTCALMPRLRTALSITCAVAWRSKDVRGKWMEKFVLPRSCTKTGEHVQRPIQPGTPT